MILTAYTKVEINPSGSGWMDVTNQVLSVRGSVAYVGDRANVLAFGSSAEVSGTVETSLALIGYNYSRTPIRITFGMDSGSGMVTEVHQGIIVSAEETTKITLGYEGVKQVISDTKVYSGIFQRRALFTATTASSVEDPTDPAYQAGPGNYILWMAGGRPLEQQYNATYQAEAVFWYTCNEAILAPPYSWVAGEDGYAELLKLAATSGGQILQQPDGVVRYRQALTIASSVGAYVFDESVYGPDGASRRYDFKRQADQIICSYLPRFALGNQEVLNDTTTRSIAPGRSISFDLEPKYPCTSYELKTATTLPDDALHLCYPHSVRVAAGSSDYSHTATTSAQKITITITNNRSDMRLILYRVIVRGSPVGQGETSTVTVGTGSIIKRIGEDSLYLQTRSDALRLARLTAAFYTAPPAITLRGCPYDPNRKLGEVVLFTREIWGVVTMPCVIVEIRHDKTGKISEYDLCQIGTALPSSDDFIPVGQTWTGRRKASY